MSDSAPPIPSPAPNECVECRQSLLDLPTGARFCPKCGRKIWSARVIEHEPPKSSLRERMEQLQSALRERRSSDTPRPPLEYIHSLTLLGYANAMLQLGWRYEHGRGVARNGAEAERCYHKSAKLGNIYARARLADQGFEQTGEPVPVLPLEEGTITSASAE